MIKKFDGFNWKFSFDESSVISFDDVLTLKDLKVLLSRLPEEYDDWMVTLEGCDYFHLNVDMEGEAITFDSNELFDDIYSYDDEEKEYLESLEAEFNEK